MITKRKLLKYRKEALQVQEKQKRFPEDVEITTQLDRVLELTQELIDQHLLKEK